MAGESLVAAIRKSNRRRARNCTKKFGAVAKVLWPYQTAFELSERAGVSVRTAKYWMSGKHPPSGRALIAIMDEIG